MSATLLLGKPVQEAILQDVKASLAEHTGAGHRPPKLAAVLVGDDPASAIYVRTKTRKCEELGIDSEAFVLPESTTTAELLERVDALNADDGVDGILVQLPLPSGVDTEAVLDRIDPRKDVDGLHPENVGLLVQKRPRFVPATPAGIMQMLDRAGIEIEGQNAVIIGRSEIVGKPMASLLMHRNATITVCHSRTRDLPAVCRGADILIVAIGRDAMVTGDFVKPGATVIDVGINRVGGRERVAELFGDDADWDKFDDRGYLVVGDVHPEVAETAGAMTPVPGGVGPLTIGMLMANTLLAARLRAGLGS
jgi:methylenetetrahydrofolate dehydrogenase (NADP+)/methenyltetrahydrofolate cyclohydrolase